MLSPVFQPRAEWANRTARNMRHSRSSDRYGRVVGGTERMPLAWRSLPESGGHLIVEARDLPIALIGSSATSITRFDFGFYSQRREAEPFDQVKRSPPTKASKSTPEFDGLKRTS